MISKSKFSAFISIIGIALSSELTLSLAAQARLHPSRLKTSQLKMITTRLKATNWWMIQIKIIQHGKFNWVRDITIATQNVSYFKKQFFGISLKLMLMHYFSNIEVEYPCEFGFEYMIAGAAVWLCFLPCYLVTLLGNCWRQCCCCLCDPLVRYKSCAESNTKNYW